MWSARALGLDLHATFPMPGLEAAATGGAGPAVRLELVAPESIAWNAEAVRRRGTVEDDDGRPVLVVEEDADGRSRLWGHERGTFVVDASGARVACAPEDGDGWRWRRFLIGQVLPVAAQRQGIELLHASAVQIGGRAIALTGPTRSGKSSVAAALHVTGAPLVADDVIALSASDDSVEVAPALPLLVVRTAESERLEPRIRERLGAVLEQTEHETLHAATGVDGAAPLPLGALYMLDDRVDGGDELRFEPVTDPRLLLGRAFGSLVQSAERDLRLLELASAIARTVLIWRAVVPGDVDAAALAAAIREREDPAA